MPSVCEDDRACRDKVPVELVVFHGGVWDAEWNRVLPSEALLDDRIHVRQVATVWVVRQPVWTNDGFEFWFMGFVSYNRSLQHLEQAVAYAQQAQ